MNTNIFTKATSILTITAFTLTAGNSVDGTEQKNFKKLQKENSEKIVLLSTQTLGSDYINKKYNSEWIGKDSNIADDLEMFNSFLNIELEQKSLDPEILSLLAKFDEISGKMKPSKKRF